MLEKLSIQSQYGSGNGRTQNLLRSPRKLEVWGGNGADFSAYERIGTFEGRHEKPGGWCTREVESSGKRYPFFRILILNNHGDLDYLTIQEMKFFSHE